MKPFCGDQDRRPHRLFSDTPSLRASPRSSSRHTARRATPRPTAAKAAKGGVSTGTLTVKPGQSLYVEVGGAGWNFTDDIGGKGGSNGGGNATEVVFGGSGGGGAGRADDVRRSQVACHCRGWRRRRAGQRHSIYNGTGGSQTGVATLVAMAARLVHLASEVARSTPSQPAAAEGGYYGGGVSLPVDDPIPGTHLQRRRWRLRLRTQYRSRPRGALLREWRSTRATVASSSSPSSQLRRGVRTTTYS